MSDGADSCDPDPDVSEVVFVESGSDRMIIAVGDANVEDVAASHSDVESAVVSQTLSDIPCNSAAEAVDCDTDLTAVTAMSVAKENDSLQASINRLAKQNVVVCKLIRNSGRFSRLNYFSCRKSPCYKSREFLAVKKIFNNVIKMNVLVTDMIRCILIFQWEQNFDPIFYPQNVEQQCS